MTVPTTKPGPSSKVTRTRTRKLPRLAEACKGPWLPYTAVPELADLLIDYPSLDEASLRQFLAQPLADFLGQKSAAAQAAALLNPNEARAALHRLEVLLSKLSAELQDVQALRGCRAPLHAAAASVGGEWKAMQAALVLAVRDMRLALAVVAEHVPGAAKTGRPPVGLERQLLRRLVKHLDAALPDRTAQQRLALAGSVLTRCTGHPYPSAGHEARALRRGLVHG